MQQTGANHLAKNTIYLYLRMIITMVVSLYTSRVVLNILGFEDFGIYNVVGSVVVFLSFMQAALRNATFRYLTYELGTGDNNMLRRIYSMSVNTHILLAISLFIFLEIFGVWFLNNRLNIAPERLYAANWAFQFSLLVFCATIVRTPYESIILAHERMDFYAITAFVEVVLKLVIVYVLVIVDFDKLIVYAFLLAVISILLLFWYYIYTKRQFKNCYYEKSWDAGILKSFIKYSGWSLLVNGACIARSQSISIFFNLFFGVIVNAALGISNQVVSALNNFVTNFTQAFKPQLIKAWASEEYDYFMKLVISTSKISYFLLLIISEPVVVNLDYCLHLWLGEYPPMTAIFIEATLIYYLIDALQEPLVVAVHATGNLKYHQIMISTIVFLVVPISYILLKCNCSGASILMFNAFSNLVCASCRVWYMRKLIKLDLRQYLFKVIWPMVLLTVLSYPIPFLIAKNLTPCLPAILFNFIISFLITAILFITLCIDKNERKLLYEIPIVKKLARHYLCQR